MLRPFLGPRSSSFERLKQSRIFLGLESSGELRRAPRSSGQLHRAWVRSMQSTYSAVGQLESCCAKASSPLAQRPWRDGPEMAPEHLCGGGLASLSG
eukprot:8480718-Alexandrium_andersonii.AAC.1